MTQITAQAHDAVREAARECGNHPADLRHQRRQRDPAGHRPLRRPRARSRSSSTSWSPSARPKRPIACSRSPTSRPPNTSSRATSTSSASTSTCTTRRPSAITWPACRTSPAKCRCMLGEYGIDTMREASRRAAGRRFSPPGPGRLRRRARSARSSSASPTTGSPTATRSKTGRSACVRRDRSPKPAFDAVASRSSSSAPQVADEKLPMVQRRHLLLQRRQHRRILPALDGAAALSRLRSHLRRRRQHRQHAGDPQEIPLGAQHPPEEHGPEPTPATSA